MISEDNDNDNDNNNYEYIPARYTNFKPLKPGDTRFEGSRLEYNRALKIIKYFRNRNHNHTMSKRRLRRMKDQPLQ